MGAKGLSPGTGTTDREMRLPMLRRMLKAVQRVLPPAPTTRYLWRKHLNPYDLLPPHPVIYDIGSQSARGRYAFGSPPPGARLVCVDIAAQPGVDIVADAHNLHMVEDNSVDCVVAQTMLMYCRNPERVISEFYRILRPGGVVCLNVAFVSADTGYPPVFQHLSVEGLEVRCATFDKIESGRNRGPASTMSHLLLDFAAILFSFNSKTLFTINKYVFSWLIFWIKYFDIAIARYELARLFYTESYFIGRKPGRTTQT
jgi:SAM-dependent methyltransferase